MNFTFRQNFLSRIYFLILAILLVSGCKPASNVSQPIEAADSPPAVFSQAKAPSVNQPTATDQDTLKRSAALVDAPWKAKPEIAEINQERFTTKFLCWNLESEGSDPKIIAQQLKEMGRYDIYALTEVLPSAQGLLEESLGPNFVLIMSRSGRNDRLAIAFDGTQFDLSKSFEIEKINFKNRYRSPLVVHLKDKNSSMEFLVMNNHLARGKEEVRLIQTKQLVDWARTQLLPVVALGDYNLDYVFSTKKGNSGFASMLHDNVWKWVQPIELIDTNWYDDPKAPDGKDDYPGSMLDFAFVSGPAKAWNATCKIIVRPGDFPDDEKTSDHRPFELRISN